MLEKLKFWAWFWALGLNFIVNKSELWAESFKVEAWALQAFEQPVHLWSVSEYQWVRMSVSYGYWVLVGIIECFFCVLESVSKY